jgi:hypothetical protein
MPCTVILEPHPLHRDPTIAQEAKLYTMYVGLIQIFEDVVVLGDPRRIVHDDAFHVTV